MSTHLKVVGSVSARLRVGLFLAVWCAYLPSSIAQDSDALVNAALLDEGNAALNGAYSDKFRDAERVLREGLGGEAPASAGTKQVKTTLVAAKETVPVKKTTSVEIINSLKVEPDRRPTESTNATSGVDAAAAALMKSTGNKISQTQPTTDTSQSIIKVLQKKLSASELHVRELERELSEAKSRLIAAELEINRLSNLDGLGVRAKLKIAAGNAPQAPEYQESQQNTARLTQVPSDERARAVAPKTDLHVATVVVDKADLRLGPGKNNSALMSLRRGSRLMVEDRHGEWYRVYAPNGERAWIHSSLVRFGDGAASLNDGSAVKVRGFDTSVEQEVFRRVQSTVAGN